MTLFDIKDQEVQKTAISKDSRTKAILGKRVYAFTFDLFAIFFIAKSLMYSYYTFISKFLYQMPVKAQTNLYGVYKDFYLSVYVLTFLGYFFATMTATHGQTPGKMLFGLKVIDPKKRGKSPQVMQFLIRSLSYLACYLAGGIWFAIPFFSKDQRGAPDWFSGTTVKTNKEYATWLNQMDFYDHSLKEWNATQMSLLDLISAHKLPTVPEFLQEEKSEIAA